MQISKLSLTSKLFTLVECVGSKCNNCQPCHKFYRHEIRFVGVSCIVFIRTSRFKTFELFEISRLLKPEVTFIISLIAVKPNVNCVRCKVTLLMIHVPRDNCEFVAGFYSKNDHLCS